MSNMAGTNSTGCMKGFSVLQPGLGAPLSWMPAVGTKELEQLINAYLPGPASAQEKRATISMDFFEFAAQTGENFKYYPVPLNAPQATRSPASSTISASPAMSNMSYGSPSQPSTPAPRTAARTSTIKAEKTDYSHLPGMKILTTDGQDVTNSVSRGCKSKEQREHAHLMRVLKACDACKKKKIRCDPSHKRRSSSQVSTKAVSKPAKKAKKAPSPSASQATSASFTPAPEASFELDLNVSLDMDFSSFPSMDIDDILAFNPEPIDANMSQDFYGAVPQDFDFFLSNEFSPAMASSTDSFDSPAQPLTPVGSGLFSSGDFTAVSETNSLAFLQAGGQEPSLPYMTPDVTHGSNYVDFNLYSPASSFVGEEPQKLKAGEKRKPAGLPDDPASPQSQHSGVGISPANLSKARPSTGLANSEQSCVNRSAPNALSLHVPQWLDQHDRSLQDVAAGRELFREIIFRGDQRPFHGDNAAHSSERASPAASPHGLQEEQQALRRSSPTTAAVLPHGLERNVSSPGSLSPVSSVVSAPVSPLTSPHLVHLDEVRVRSSGSSVHSRTVSPSELHVVVSSSSSAPLARAPISVHPVPTAVSPTAASSLLRGEQSSTGGLFTAGGIDSPILDGQHNLAAISGSSPSGASVLAPRQTAGPVRVLGSATGSTALFRLEAAGRSSGTTNVATTTTSSSGLVVLSHSLQRQALHGHDDVTAASSSPRRSLASIAEGNVTPLLPVRQWPGQPCIPSETLTQLAVFGLVSMLLIMGLTSLLHLQSPIFAHLPSSSSSSLVFLSCLSTLSSKQDVLDNAKSIRRRQGRPGRRSGLSAMAGLAGYPLACFQG
ncbi:hypothetical protein N0V93_009052 [Gnomoniopsis smithogilvyi]|uniref:Uncharacterized protein n=1 Tax=Gnomoniopsis smithogilvyi TaxID=1191159 RepID=A0A9W9CTE9_9PEZI|nr:hypothetical protein N0V93_009052 [Gnomoniopsis smithogilvyi]